MTPILIEMIRNAIKTIKVFMLKRKQKKKLQEKE